MLKSVSARGGIARHFLAVGVSLAAAACSKHLPLAQPAAPLTPPTHLCVAGDAPGGCRSPRQLESLLQGELEILSMDDTPSGAQGAKILTLASRSAGQRTVFRARWRAQSTDGLINEPRKELAAYAVQKLFLGAEELAAPPTSAHCFPLADYRRFAPEEKPTFEHADCVLGFATYWLEDVKSVESAREADWLDDDGKGLWDAELYEEDALYRSSISRVNLLTYLINHGDAHENQFMIERTSRGLVAYVVDCSIAFLSIKNPMLLVRQDWSALQVPQFPRSSIARLRALRDEDFARLGVIARLQLRGRQLHSLPLPADNKEIAGEMSWHGQELHIGLTDAEIQLVKDRVRELLARPDLDARLF
jgi:hypothetical protein